MLESIRKYSKLLGIPIFALVILSFVLFGTEQYMRTMNSSEMVAKVDGQKITQQELDYYHRNNIERLRASRPNLDPKELDSPQLKDASLQNLVRERVLSAAAQTLRLSVSDHKLARSLQSDSSIADLYNSEGKLDSERYRQLLASRGLTPIQFEANARANLAFQQVLGGVTQSAISPAAQAQIALNAFFERRQIQVLTFNPNDYKKRVTPADADLETYYAANSKAFQLPEQANIEYLVLGLDQISQEIKVDEDAIKKQYEEYQKQEQDTKEERRASHILIKIDKDSSASERQAAKAKAQSLLEQVRKEPQSFAEVAKKNSQDPGSANSGGDLNFFTRKAMVKPFSDAAFVLQKNEISEVVESDFGYHIIQLTDIKPAAVKTLNQVRPELEAQAKKELAQKKFADIAEKFTNAVYENSGDLNSVAQEFKLTLKTAQNLTREPNPTQVDVLNQTKVLDALFSSESINNKRSTEAIETAPNQLLAARITQYQAAQLQTLDQVKDKVKDLVVAQKANELAKEDGAIKLQEWKMDASKASALPAAMIISRDAMEKQSLPVIKAALSAPTNQLPAWVGVDLKEQGFAIVKVGKVLPREKLDAERQKQEQSQFAQWWSNAESQAYYDFLSSKFKTQVKSLIKTVDASNN